MSGGFFSENFAHVLNECYRIKKNILSTYSREKDILKFSFTVLRSNEGIFNNQTF